MDDQTGAKVFQRGAVEPAHKAKSMACSAWWRQANVHAVRHTGLMDRHPGSPEKAAEMMRAGHHHTVEVT